MSLQDKIDAAKAASAEKIPPEILKVMKGSIEALTQSGMAQRALKTGDTAPSFELEDVSGTTVRSADILEKGPMVLTFYRGAW